MNNTIIKSGALIPVLLMLPNVAWMLSPKANEGKKVSVPLVLTIVENVGRIAIMILPFFYLLDLEKEYSIPIIIGMGLALAIYYITWIRYFVGGRSAVLLKTSLLSLPLPLAVAPVIFLVISSYLMSSWVMLVASILFGAAHIWVSIVDL